MSDDPGQTAVDPRRQRIAAMLGRLAYRTGAVAGGEPARQVDLALLPSLGQAVWVTADRIDFVDYYYRPLLQLDVGRKDIGVTAGTEGRWSYFTDSVAYAAAGREYRRAPTTVRQMVGPFEGALVIVLATRPPGVALTVISVTVMPNDEDPRLPGN